MSMSPPEAPSPDVTAFGCPRYSRPQPEAVEPPTAPRPRQSWLPPPRPSSEPANTLLARETWIAGSPAEFVPHPLAPIVADWSWPNEKLPTVEAARLTGRP